MMNARATLTLLGCLSLAGCAGTPASSSPAVSVNPTAVTFPSTAIGSSSTAAVTMSVGTDVSIGISSSNTAEFPFSTSCVSAMTAGSSCAITVQFRPVLPGDRSAKLLINASSGTIALTLSGSASGGTVTPDRNTPLTITIATEQPDPFYLSPGQTTGLAAVAITPDGGSQDVTAAATWTSSDAGVASVSRAGLVTAVSAGSASISVTYLGHTSFIRIFVVSA
jgi:uncharacterized protein YjdB